MSERIVGYRTLSEAEIELINQCKSMAKQVGALIDRLEECGDDAVDRRWLAIARTDLQKGFMALVRSIAQPETF